MFSDPFGYKVTLQRSVERLPFGGCKTEPVGAGVFNFGPRGSNNKSPHTRKGAGAPGLLLGHPPRLLRKIYRLVLRRVDFLLLGYRKLGGAVFPSLWLVGAVCGV